MFTVSFNCDCNNSRCFRSDHIAQCCNTECAAGCSGGGNADQCRVCNCIMMYYTSELPAVFEIAVLMIAVGN